MTPGKRRGESYLRITRSPITSMKTQATATNQVAEASASPPFAGGWIAVALAGYGCPRDCLCNSDSRALDAAL
jgi:hypothetical protein